MTTTLTTDERALLAAYANDGGPLFLPDALSIAFSGDPWHVPDLFTASSLMEAGLLRVVGRGVYEITEAGRQALGQQPRRDEHV